MWHPIYESIVRVTACVPIGSVCCEEIPLYLRFKEEKIMHNLAKVISWQAAFDEERLRGAYKHLIVTNRRRFNGDTALAIRHCGCNEKMMPLAQKGKQV